MTISLNSDLYMRYGWNDSLIEKMVRNYGEEYLRDREATFDNLEDTLDDNKIVKVFGATLYHLTPTATVMRMHAESITDMVKCMMQLYSDQKAKLDALGGAQGVKLDGIWEVLEVDAAIRSDRNWHKQLFSVVKNFHLIESAGIPKESRGMSLIVGRNKNSSIDVLWDIFRKVFIDMELGDANTIEEGIAYLKSKSVK